MTYSCCKYERCDQPCADQMSVAKLVPQAIGKEFSGFTHNDIALRWWVAFMHLVYKDTTSANINQYFHRLANSEVKGPRLQKPVDECIPIEEHMAPEPALERLKNYDKNSIDLQMVHSMYHTIGDSSVTLQIQLLQLQMARQDLCQVTDQQGVPSAVITDAQGDVDRLLWLLLGALAASS